MQKHHFKGIIKANLTFLFHEVSCEKGFLNERLSFQKSLKFWYLN